MVSERFEKIRQWIVVIGFSTAASIFWGAIVAAIARHALNIDSDNALLFVGGPIAVLLDIYFIPRAGKYFGFR